MDEKALKLVSVEFRDLSSDAIRADFERIPACLRRLLAFIEETPILREAIASSATPDDDAAEDIKGLSSQRRARLVPPSNRETELRYAYDAVTYLARLEPTDILRMCVTYGGVSHARDGRPKLMADTAGELAAGLRRVITAALLETETVSRGVDVRATDGGTAQVVVHQGVGDIHAHLDFMSVPPHVQASLNELQRLADSEDVPEGVRQEIGGMVDVARHEIEKARPSRWTLKAVSESLVRIGAAVEAVKGPAKVIWDWVSALGKAASG